MSSPGLGDLSVETKAALLRDLVVELSTELTTSRGRAPYPRGAQDYFAQFLVRWFPSHDVNFPRRDVMTLRAMAVHGEADVSEEWVDLPIGQGQFVVIDLLKPDLYDVLDARGDDLGPLAAAVLRDPDAPGDEIVDSGLVGQLSTLGSYAILVNHIEVFPAWRGTKAGLLATAAVLQELCRGCAFAALYPMPPGLKTAESCKLAQEGLRRYWAQLGFESWTDEVMVLSLIHTYLDLAVAALGVE